FRLLSSLSVYVAHRVLPSFPTRRSSDLIISVVIILAFLSEIPWWQVMPFVLLFAYLIFRPLLKALKEMEPKFIGKAVKAGVLSLIVLNAALASVFAGWIYGLIVLLLLPVSIIIAKKFSVT